MNTTQSQGAPRTCRCIETSVVALGVKPEEGQGAPRTCKCIEISVRSSCSFPSGASATGSSVRWHGRVSGAGAGTVGIGCAVRGRSGRCCTFDRDPPLEDPRNHAETPRRSTLLKSSHVQTGLLCTWESADARSTIRENRGILRKTRNRPAGPPPSHVQSARPTGPGEGPRRPGATWTGGRGWSQRAEGPRRPGATVRPIRAARACPGDVPPERDPGARRERTPSTRACAPSAPVRAAMTR